MNTQKQKTSDYYVIKTLDHYGLVRHLKAQLWDHNGFEYVFDYDISYNTGSATFKGSRRVYYWVLNDQSDPNNAPPDAPKHPMEEFKMRENRSFQAFFDHNSGFAKEIKYVGKSASELKLTYDRQYQLAKVDNYIVTNDSHGNIISMLLPSPEPYIHEHLGVTYFYNQKHVKKAGQYYETPYIFINPFYSLIEVLNWGPFQPSNERTGVSLQYMYSVDELPSYYPDQYVDAQYSNHKYDANGNLISYDFNGELSHGSPYYPSDYVERDRIITWKCKSDN
ncbi:MAG: hypothetical protein ABI415_08315 [Flavitalea sp.]